MDRSDSMQEVFRKYLNNECSPEEAKELFAYFHHPENEAELRGLILQTLESEDLDDDGSKWNPATEESLAVIKKKIAGGAGKVVPFYQRSWIRIAVAALLVIGGFSAYKLITGTGAKSVIVNTKPASTDPGAKKALLTFADGKTVPLETLSDGIITNQGTSQVSKGEHGQLIYKSLSEKPIEVVYNTLKTPRGGEYRLVLADGSRIWLNTASSLRFPAAFTGSERRVELVGEAYFEIAKNSSMPFVVSVPRKGEVQVLGTHFNVTAYGDESLVKTTLLEGSVKVSVDRTNEIKLVKPGEQAQINTSGQIMLKANADLDAVLAWKNGAFHFNDADVRQVMRQISRWYDVDVVYEGKVPDRRFTGEMQRELSLPQVLNLLEKNKIVCILNGTVLTVKSSQRMQ